MRICARFRVIFYCSTTGKMRVPTQRAVRSKASKSKSQSVWLRKYYKSTFCLTTLYTLSHHKSDRILLTEYYMHGKSSKMSFELLDILFLITKFLPSCSSWNYLKRGLANKSSKYLYAYIITFGEDSNKSKIYSQKSKEQINSGNFGYVQVILFIFWATL
jgi:hypothetical protein